MSKSRNYPPNLRGMKRHYKSGHAVNIAHFTGTKGGKRVRRKGLTRKMRKMKRGTHVNKYASSN